MTSHRFFIDPTLINQGKIDFPEEIAHQVARVLRLRQGASIWVMDNQGSTWLVELDVVEGSRVLGHILQQEAARGEPPVCVTVFICLTQREKFEWVLQKGTEVGVDIFAPLVSQRSLVQNLKDAEGKRERWDKILREAAEQCGRGRIPRLLPAAHFKKGLVPEVPGALRLLCRVEERTVRLQQAMEQAVRLGHLKDRVDILTGPEGGLTQDEAEAARAAGFQPVSLGPRILRMETAAITAATLVLHEWGDLG